MRVNANNRATPILGMESVAYDRSAKWLERRRWEFIDMAAYKVLNLPVLRWGQPYTSLEQDTVIHFATGQTLAKVSQANPGLLSRGMRHAQRDRDGFTEIPIHD